MEKHEYLECHEVYRLGKDRPKVELYLDNMMEWTIKSVALGLANPGRCEHTLTLSYDYQNDTRKYESRVVIARLIPKYCECIKPDIRVSMNDKIKLELVHLGAGTGDVDVYVRCFMPPGCDITKSSPLNTIQKLQRKREREAHKGTKGQGQDGNETTDSKGKKKPSSRPSHDKGLEENFDETIGANKRQSSRERDKKGALINETMTLDAFFSDKGELIKGEEGLMYRDHNMGTGQPLAVGQRARIKCSGRLANGHFFQSSKKGDFFDIRVGGGELIKGLEKGIVGMKVGGSRTIVVPPGLGYGSKGTPGIPGGATLLFEVRLIAIDAPLEATMITKRRNKK